MTGQIPLAALDAALGATILGQRAALLDVLTSLLARGHVLLEGVPGVAKTLIARTLAQALGLKSARVQFTPDLMPSDLLGTSVFRPNSGTFDWVRGPVFTQLLVADEINRTAPKTQAALLECMEERQVTLDGITHLLDPAFFVVATQNPLELEGTYPLPEAQLDRFLMRIRVGYPDEPSEVALVQAFHERGGKAPQVTQVFHEGELAALVAVAAAARCDASIIQYVVALVRHTRNNPKLRIGASPRAGQALLSAAKARAALNGHDYVTPDEVKSVAASVLNHRLILTAESEVEGVTADDVIGQALEQVQVPR